MKFFNSVVLAALVSTIGALAQADESDNEDFGNLNLDAQGVEGRFSSFKLLSKVNEFDFLDMKNLITFGDSYTTTNVDYETMISPGRLETSSYGSNWIYHMSDATGMKFYNFADGGATVTCELAPAWKETVKSFVDQVRLQFVPKMTGDGPFTDWNSNNSLFGIWFGINDVGNLSWGNKDLNRLDYEAMDLLIYFNLVEELYNNGARNFIFLGVPSIDRSPFYTVDYPDSTIKERVDRYNNLLKDKIQEFYGKHDDVNAFYYDTYSEFVYIEENYEEYGITELHELCPDLNNPDETCLPSEQYYWGNSLHPTHVVHKIMTDDIIEFLEN